MGVTTPHFALPFRFIAGTAAVTEQDSTEEVMDCVQAIVRYTHGDRTELPEFGLPDLLFTTGDIDTELIDQLIQEWEPRAESLSEEIPDEYDQTIRHILIQAQGGNDA